MIKPFLPAVIIVVALIGPCLPVAAQETPAVPAEVLVQPVSQPAPLPAELLGRLDTIEKDIRALHSNAAQDRSDSRRDLKERSNELRDGIKALREAFDTFAARQNEAADKMAADIRKLPEDTVAKMKREPQFQIGAGAPVDEGSGLKDYAVVIAASLAGLSCLVSIVLLLRMKGLQDELSRLAQQGVSRPAAQPAAAVVAQAQNNSAPALARVEEKLAAIAQTLARPAQDDGVQAIEKLTETQTELLGRLGWMEAVLQKLSEPQEAPNEEPQEAALPALAGLVWPKAARSAEAFPLWSRTLASAIEAGQADALQLAGLMLEYQSGASRRDMAQDAYCELLRRLGRAIYRFCYSLDVSDDDRLDAAQAVLRQVKEDAAALFPHIELRAVFPNERLNTDHMEKLDSGGRLVVSRPMSWLILDRTPGRERVLARAQVITG